MPLTIIPVKDIQHFTNYAEHHFYDSTLYLSELEGMVSSIILIMNATKLHAVGAHRKYDRNIIERGTLDTTNIQIHHNSLSWLGTQKKCFYPLF